MDDTTNTELPSTSTGLGGTDSVTPDEVSLSELLTNTSVTQRPSSTSSVETITFERIQRSGPKNKKRKEKVHEPCSSCGRLILGVALRSAKKTYRGFSDIRHLQLSAKKCAMCALLWHILRGSDDSLVDQILKYSDNDFNSTGLYHPDGGTDIDELLAPGPKVKITVTASLSKRRMKRLSHISCTLRFDISYKTHAGSRRDMETSMQEDVTIFCNPGI